MDIFIKVSAGILITAILCLVISGQNKDISLLLTIFMCCVSILAATSYLEPILDFARKLIQVGNLKNDYLQVLMKIVGIGVISQVAGFICRDAGNQSLAKVLQIVTTSVVLCICIPLLEEILALIETVLGEI